MDLLGGPLGSLGEPLDQSVDDDFGHVIHLFHQSLRVTECSLSLDKLSHAGDVEEDFANGGG